MKKTICPFLKKKCIEGDCALWSHILGTNPQTGSIVDLFDCSVKWLPILLAENSKQTRGAQSAIESMRNAVVKRQDELNNAVKIAQQNPKRIEND